MSSRLIVGNAGVTDVGARRWIDALITLDHEPRVAPTLIAWRLRVCSAGAANAARRLIRRIAAGIAGHLTIGAAEPANTLNYTQA